MEKILKIEEITECENCGQKVGYAVVTNEQTIKLLIDNDQCCCEHWGYFWCNDNPQDFVGANVLSVGITDTALNEAKMKEEGPDTADKWFEGGVMFVNIDTDRGQLQFVAYNEHNGYYGHNAVVVSKQLTHEECL
jgi:hypothetical protein